MTRNSLEAVLALLGNLFAWVAQTETIWMGMLGSYQAYLVPVYDLPDFRGPMAAVTLIYVGLRLGDLLNAKKEIKDTL